MKIDSAPRLGTLPPSTVPDEEAASPPQSESDLVEASRPLGRRTRLWIILAAVAICLLFLFAVRAVIQPFIWAIVLAYVLHPVVSFLQRRLGARRGVGVASVMIVLLGGGVWGVAAIVPPLRSDYAALASSLAVLDSYMSSYVANSGTLMIVGIPVQTSQLIHGLQSTIINAPSLVLGNGLSFATHAIENILSFLTFVISTFYLLLDGPQLGAWLTGRMPAAYRQETVALARRVGGVLSDYVRAEIILIAIMSVASFIALSFLGMRFSLLLAPIVGFLEIFPVIGPFCAITLVSLVALVSPPNFGVSHVGYAVIVALVFFILRQLEDYLVIPNVVGHAVKLHPVLILFALLSGATIGGILGMFLAVPITGVLKIVGGYAYDRVVK